MAALRDKEGLVISLEIFRSVVDYNSEKGCLVWKKQISNRIKVGEIVGGPTSNGYLKCSILGVSSALHRFIWYWHTGSWPEEDIDHINGDRKDNKIGNLREASRSQNNMNYDKPKDNTTGYRGVYLDKRVGKYYWQVVYEGKIYSGCSYDSPKEASIDRDLKADILSGGFVFKPEERLYNEGAWSKGQYNSFIKSMLRRGSTRWGPKYACKKEARHSEKLTNDKGRLVFHSLCADCGNIYPETTCAVDHILPVIDPSKGFTSWDDVINRLFCEKDNLQVLCKTCHDIKTKEEKAVDKERRKRERATKVQ